MRLHSAFPFYQIQILQSAFSMPIRYYLSGRNTTLFMRGGVKVNQQGIKSITGIAQTVSSPSVGEDQIHIPLSLCSAWAVFYLLLNLSSLITAITYTILSSFIYSCPIYYSNPCLIDSYVFFPDLRASLLQCTPFRAITETHPKSSTGA